MTSQRVPFKYCYSFSSDQKRHLCKVNLFFQDSHNISRFFTDTNYERQHLGIYHSCEPQKGWIHFLKLHSESKGRYSLCLQPPTKAISEKMKNVKASTGCGPSCHSPKKLLQHYESELCTSFHPTFFSLQTGSFAQHGYWK